MTAHAAIHTGLKQLGIEGDDARDLYARVTGRRSLREMSPRQHEAVVSELRRLGFKAASSGARKPLEGRFAKKLQALWIAGWNLGVVADRRDEALVAFVKRQTGIDHVRFVRDDEDAAKAIEALKAWLARETGIDWSQGRHLAEWVRPAGARIAVAQWQILHKAGAMSSDIREFRDLVARLARPIDQMEERDWPAVMNLLGQRVRKVATK